ncbi:OmpP1/FadL family transporter [Sphingomonas aracearum]|uniref:Aromatic hydrocarbon degradation protein n=1 Tax=Sphingomonas aracearum TaxID=2283317 RepID=A0A369VZE9_9SPHN|nr:outer membrane protein transport protein [Sphingomonas aracearum]RDE07513.1 aromatic hydrocarbon degradation protein [Sphingomonas aracearum]
MSHRKNALLAASAIAASIAFAGAAHAQAFYLQEQSARGAGRAFSGEAADTGPQSLWWNPASIADLPNAEVALNVSTILPKGDVRDNGTVIRRPGQAFTSVGGNSSSSDPINNGVLPSGAIAIPFGRVAFGLAVTSPYSFTTNYDADSWARYSADKTKLRTVDIQPSVAVAVTDWLRVGGGANIEYTDAYLSNALPNISPVAADGSQVLKGDGWDVGWTAGVQLHNDWATVGISYKSDIKHTLKGDLEIAGLTGALAGQNRQLSDVKATFYTPAQIIVGGRFRATDALTLNTQFVRYTWSKFDAIRLGTPVNTAIPEGYRDIWSYAAGVDYAVSPKLTLRTGVQRTNTPTEDGERDARVPDSNRWNFAAGASFQATPRLGFDLAANYIDFKDESIDRVTAAYAGTVAQTPIVTNGRLENAHALVFSLGGRFSF